MECLHPVKIDDPKHPGHKMLVSCGTCAVCLKARADLWTQRMKVESSQHKYVWFLTLTYSDEFVPIFRPEECLEYEYFTDKQRQDTYEWLSEHEASEQYLVLRYRDAQLFIKRLRSYIYDDPLCSAEEKSIRFVCVGEYGETTYRPHFHFIIWSDSDYLNSSKCRHYRDGRVLPLRCPLERYIRKAWQYERKTSDGKGVFRQQIGRIDFQRVKDQAARYVAQYVSCFSWIPSLLRSSAFRPFICSSKFPTIGSFGLSVEKAKEIIINGKIELLNEQGNEYDRNLTVPLWRSIKDRLFPKLPRDYALTVFERRLLYGFVAEKGFLSFDEFRSWFCLEDLKNVPFESWQDEQFRRQFEIDLYKVVSPDDRLVGYEEICSAFYEKDSPLNRSLVRLWRISALFAHNCAIYNLKINDYVDYIDKFYSKLNYLALTKQLSHEQVYSQQHGSKELLSYVDPYFLYRENLAVDPQLRVESSFGIASDDSPENHLYYSVSENCVHRDRSVAFVEIGKSYKRKSDVVIHKGLSNVGTI